MSGVLRAEYEASLPVPVEVFLGFFPVYVVPRTAFFSLLFVLLVKGSTFSLDSLPMICDGVPVNNREYWACVR